MRWTADAILELARSYQTACILAAAVDLDLFSTLAPAPLTAKDIAARLECDVRGLTILLDALAAVRLLVKRGELYSVADGVGDTLSASGYQSVLAMAQHQANCLRRWAQLAAVIKTGKPADRLPSIRGEALDLEAFIGAMHNVSAPIAAQVIRALEPLQFRHLLDVGGASGTWTAAFLSAYPRSTATLFDLPEVLPMARSALKEAGFEERVTFVPGDFLKDRLPAQAGSDLAWVSAIVHQNSREQNRQLFRNVFEALVPGGRVAIRDILMDPTRTRPVAGALFAVNMLAATEGGGTFTFEELRDDLVSAGFESAAVARSEEGMNSVVVAEKPR